jgi:hypothetical protein
MGEDEDEEEQRIPKTHHLPSSLPLSGCRGMGTHTHSFSRRSHASRTPGTRGKGGLRLRNAVWMIHGD